MAKKRKNELPERRCPVLIMNELLCYVQHFDNCKCNADPIGRCTCRLTELEQQAQAYVDDAITEAAAKGIKDAGKRI